jgi:hypothetical protein
MRIPYFCWQKICGARGWKPACSLLGKAGHVIRGGQAGSCLVLIIVENAALMGKNIVTWLHN